MSNKLITIYSGSTVEAHIWKAKLESAGIKAVVIHDIPTGGAQYTELQVMERDAKKASTIVKPNYRPFPIMKRSDRITGLILGAIFIIIGGFILAFAHNLGGGIGFIAMGACFITLALIAKTLKK